MNKYDIILTLIILIIGITIFCLFKIGNNNPKEAIVYYDGDIVLKIDLSDHELRTYTIEGFNGDVVIETIDGKIRVVEEESPKHLCSIQGYISTSYESIICLPNKVVVEINDSIDVDTIVR
ncbi:MAG: NusG domain II-containing protein [Bacilli bacterium]|nr:NusG domain II-containing protein [Bacilli bacterium]